MVLALRETVGAGRWASLEKLAAWALFGLNIGLAFMVALKVFPGGLRSATYSSTATARARHRRLRGYVQAVAGARYAAGLGDGPEITQVLEIKRGHRQYSYFSNGMKSRFELFWGSAGPMLRASSTEKENDLAR